jgi:hypothetical protein
VQQPTIHQHPLAYLLGLEGIALLRAFSGGYDREFTAARLLEIKELLDSTHELGAGIEATPLTTREGYAQWAPFYDEPGNQLLDIEQPPCKSAAARSRGDQPRWWTTTARRSAATRRPRLTCLGTRRISGRCTACAQVRPTQPGAARRPPSSGTSS